MSETVRPRPAPKIADTRRTLLLVDDEAINLQLLRHTLQDDYRLLFAKDGFRAQELARSDKPDLILLDVMMPGMSGCDVCKNLKSSPETSGIPIIFVTALADAADEQHGLQQGAVDYITKPFNPHIVRARVRNHLSLVQAHEVVRTRRQIIECLGAAAEFKDNETGLHVIRMSRYARTLALAAGYSEEAADELLHAAPMHDVGKIGIPDMILQKPGKLTPEEYAVMQKHTEIGARIIGEHAGGLLHLASMIALNHHEKWDGSGYPHGIAGENIPHAARIVAIADVFDALTSVRPYKDAWPLEKAVAFIQEQSGRHFDPDLVEVFTGCVPDFVRIREQWRDEKEATPPDKLMTAAE